MQSASMPPQDVHASRHLTLVKLNKIDFAAEKNTTMVAQHRKKKENGMAKLIGRTKNKTYLDLIEIKKNSTNLI